MARARASKTGQFQPGSAWTGNRRGRPKKGAAIAELLRHIGDLQYRGHPLTYRQRAAEMVWELACAGELAALQFIVERTEGKTPERLDVSGSISQEHSGAVEIHAVDYRHSIRALTPPVPPELEDKAG